MMLEAAPAALTATLTTDTHPQHAAFWKDQIIASFCRIRKKFKGVLHFRNIRAVLSF